MTEYVPLEGDVAALADELIKVRGRGLDAIDVSTPPQKRLVVEYLERLADAHDAAGEFRLVGRIAKIGRFLKDGISEYAARGDEAEAAFLVDLFFDPEGQPLPSKAGVRLERALEARNLPRYEFDEVRRPMFERLASFLLVLAAGAAPVDAPPATIIVNRSRNTRKRVLWSVSVGAAVSIVAVVVLIAMSASGRSDLPRGLGGTTGITSTPGPLLSIGAAPAGTKTFREQQGSYGGPTVAEPFGPSGGGQKIPAFSWVEVSCKVLAPSIKSASPDGYWYRIASSPWNDQYYACANTFMNGDLIGGPVNHNTDFNVPDC